MSPVGTDAETHLTTQRERLAGVVQAIGRNPVDIERRRWESLLVFAGFTLAYAFIGRWLVVDAHVVGFETLDRFNRALMFWHNDPAKLASVGFDTPPLTVLFLAPFTIFAGPARALTVVPLGSAVFAGLTMMVLNTMMRRAGVAAPLRAVLLVALGINPLVVLYGSTGARHFIWIAFATAALGALVAWYITADVRFVLIAGLSFSLAALSGYTSLVWFAVSAVAVGATLSRLGARGDEVEGTTVGFAVPTVYVVALWTVFNLILVTRPFHWITESSDRAGAEGVDLSLAELARGTGELVLYGAPLTLVVLPALLYVGMSRTNPLALWLGVLLLVAVLTPAASALLGLTGTPMMMREALPVLVLSVVGALWLARSAGERATLVAAVTAVGLLASAPWTFQAMRTFEPQGLESAFADAVSTGRSQEGARTPDGSAVGYGSEDAMARYIRTHIGTRGSILTDNAQTNAVMLLTGRPDLFFDRVDRSDDAWLEAARDPASHVDYLLLSTDSDQDLLTRLYPEAADGSDVFLPDIFRTDRYVLVGVPDGYQRDPDATQPDETLQEGS